MANVCRKRYKKWKNIGNYIENGPSYRFKSWDMLSKTIFLIRHIKDIKVVCILRI